ncbi:uncharacterized protein E0L32_004515 [Thyridium curvatum]|uniref:Uncharacterized protein n=1 Tax=Thyridium curvatum TaxID=1093900 RepID=A0A507BEM9_9PEZI|nr:uncharacterized protein E0L32_004515 [Thyridium curvatum]TPX15238.1 hypothetical protein E0L32_004515 [Thyridium curvatum]
MAPPAVKAGIEILAPPTILRSVFLDFGRFKPWSPNLEITAKGENKDPVSLVPGDKITVKAHGVGFSGEVVENTPERFVVDSWLPFGLIVGRRYFTFSASSTNQDDTAFMQLEEFRGPLSGILGSLVNQQKPSPGFATFNEAFKKECERRSTEQVVVPNNAV